MLRPRFAPSATLLLLAAASAPLAGQASAVTPRDTVAPARAPAAPAPPPAAPMNISGLVFGSYNVTPSTTPNQLANQADNAFIIDRAYLTFRAAITDRMFARVTTDVYQTTEATPNAYAIRAKYAYLQYDTPRHADGSAVMGRIGMLQNVVIEHAEGFWPRFLSQTAVERAGYFPSADVGVAGGYTLPNRLGEVYATVANGAGYSARERDRFKDYAARVSLTPLANGDGNALVKSFTLTLWGYKGATASGFVNGGPGQAGAVGAALDRSRAGILAGIRDPRFVLAAEHARSRDGRDVGLNTPLSPRTGGAVSGHLTSAFTVVRPFAFTNATGRSPFAIVARYDHVKPSARSENLAAPLPDNNAYHTLIAGMIYDVNPRVAFAADYQESLASRNGISLAPPAQAKGYFLHFSVAF